MKNENLSVGSTALRFSALFAGLDRVYGVYNKIAQQRADGKLTGEPFTKREPVTDELWVQHLTGKNGLGIVPIRDDGTCRFGAIDIDVYQDLDPAQIAAMLERLKLPLIPCRSKSGGVHIYCFTAEPVPAVQMRNKLQEVAAILGHGDCEIFPKQNKLQPDENGSWLNLPYFNGDAGTRYAVRPNSDALTLAEFLDAAETARVGQGFFTEKQPDVPISDGPPCLGHLVTIGIPPGTRNTTLFNLGIYSKRKSPDSWKADLENYNRTSLDPPLGADEVLNAIKSISKKEYRYACDKSPLAQHCNRAVCKTRRFGIGDAGEMPVLGPLVKFDSTPPRYLWEIDGKRVPLSSDEILNYALFTRACFERLNKVLPDLKPKEWKVWVAKALERLHIEAAEDASPEAQFWGLLDKFCTWNPATVLEEVLLGRTFNHEGKTYFRLSDLLAFLATQRFRECSMQEIAAILKERGAVHKFRVIGGKGTNLWGVPEFGGQTDPYPVPQSIENDQPVF